MNKQPNIHVETYNQAIKEILSLPSDFLRFSFWNWTDFAICFDGYSEDKREEEISNIRKHFYQQNAFENGFVGYIALPNFYAVNVKFSPIDKSMFIEIFQSGKVIQKSIINLTEKLPFSVSRVFNGVISDEDPISVLSNEVKSVFAPLIENIDFSLEEWKTLDGRRYRSVINTVLSLPISFLEANCSGFKNIEDEINFDNNSVDEDYIQDFTSDLFSDDAQMSVWSIYVYLKSGERFFVNYDEGDSSIFVAFRDKDNVHRRNARIELTIYDEPKFIIIDENTENGLKTHHSDKLSDVFSTST